MKANPSDPLSGRIYTIRGQRVIIDTDLALLYGTTTKRFNEAFKRNASRFPTDFAFQLNAEEFAALRSQYVTSNSGAGRREEKEGMWSQIATTSKPQRRRIGNIPWAFTEHGAVMAANVLRSPKAVGDVRMHGGGVAPAARRYFEGWPNGCPVGDEANK